MKIFVAFYTKTPYNMTLTKQSREGLEAEKLKRLSPVRSQRQRGREEWTM